MKFSVGILIIFTATILNCGRSQSIPLHQRHIKKCCTRYSNRHKKNSKINFFCFDIFIFSITTCQTVHRFSVKVTKLFNKYSIEIWISQLNVIEFSIWMERYLKEHFLYWNWFSFPTNLNIYAAKKERTKRNR